MSTALALLKWASTALFGILGIVTVVGWARHRGRQRGYIAMAVGLLALVALASSVSAIPAVRSFIQGDRALAIGLGGAELTVFTLSGYALLLLRDSLLPLGERSRATFRWAVRLAVVGSFVALIPLSSPALAGNPSPAYSLDMVIAVGVVLYVIALWCVCVAEPAIRLWREARTRRAVQRARIRALSGGYGLIVVILIVDVIGFKAATDPAFQLATQLIVLLAIPALYASLTPPRWLRRAWRAKEEEQYYSALRELMALAADPERLAERSVEWAARLTGAESAAIVTDDGRLLAGDASVAAAARRGDRALIAVPLVGQRMPARVLIQPGVFTPLFGSDEILRLEQYAVNLGMALDHSRLVQALDSRAREAERSNVELERFAYVASHDLKEPLRMVASYVRLLEQRYLDRLDADADDFIGFAVEGVTRMAALIDDMLAYSRPGTDVKELSTVDAGAALAVALDNLGPDIDAAGARITWDRLPLVRSDAVELSQVFQNLVANAVKFRGEAAPVVHVSSRMDKDMCLVSVRDNGIGVDPEHRDRIFHMFQRLHGRSQFPGTGIGLAICRRIIERQGGRIGVEPSPGGGAIFSFTLPAARSAGAGQGTRWSPEIADRKPKVAVTSRGIFSSGDRGGCRQDA